MNIFNPPRLFTQNLNEIIKRPRLLSFQMSLPQATPLPYPYSSISKHATPPLNKTQGTTSPKITQHNKRQMQRQKTNQVIDDMRSRSVPPRITEPLATRRHIAPHNTRGIGNPAIPASVFSEIPFPILIVIIITGVLEIQSAHPRRERIHHLAAVPATTAPRPAALCGTPGSRGDRRGI